MCKYFISPVYTVHLGRDPNSIMANFVTLICQGQFCLSKAIPLSPYIVAKRASASVLLSLARLQSLVLNISRDSPNAALSNAFKKVSRHVHPDRGGAVADSQRLSVARDNWDEARKGPRTGAGRPAKPKPDQAPPGDAYPMAGKIEASFRRTYRREDRPNDPNTKATKPKKLNEQEGLRRPIDLSS